MQLPPTSPLSATLLSCGTERRDGQKESGTRRQKSWDTLDQAAMAQAHARAQSINNKATHVEKVIDCLLLYFVS